MDYLKKNLSLVTVLISILFLFQIRWQNINPEKELSWDVLGYYIYLPASFVHHDPLLNDISWLKKINDEKKLSDTLYQISQNENGDNMYFFLGGMAIFYLPFFLLAHLFAGFLGFTQNGFSEPYAYFLAFGCIIYTLIGLLYLRKILLNYFSELISALLIFFIVFATNYSHHLSIKNLETVNILFMLTSIIIWQNIQWHKTQKLKNLLILGISFALMALVKPSEILIIFLPILWGVFNKDSFLEKLNIIKRNWKQFALLIPIIILIAMPQLLYWKLKTGQFIYDSYKNPQVGLDFFNPHILDVLFSYRKGWFIYTPIMIFSIIGFYFLFKKNRSIFSGIVIYFGIAFYVVSSWSEWWYGAAFSMRPLITYYPLLAISLGYFLQWISTKAKFIKFSFGIVATLCVLLNNFQWWQLMHYILDPYRTTKEYYWNSFLVTDKNKTDENLKSVYRSFDGSLHFDASKYKKQSIIFLENMEHLSSEKLEYNPVTKNNYFKISSNDEFCFTKKIKFSELTSKDHIWIKLSFDVQYNSETNKFPLAVMSMERKEGSYAYLTKEIKTESGVYFEMFYLSPEVRSEDDTFVCYIWNKDKIAFSLDNFKLETFEELNFLP